MAYGKFVFRDGGSDAGDVDAIMNSLDASLIRLKQTGNVGQWGEKKFSDRLGYRDGVIEDLEISEKARLENSSNAKRTLMVETCTFHPVAGVASSRVDAQGVTWLQVGSLELWENEMGDHIYDNELLKPHVEVAKELPAGYLYLNFLLADFRAGENSRGVGKAMIEYSKDWARRRGMKAIYLDCWVGGTRKLLKYVTRNQMFSITLTWLGQIL